MSSFVTRFRDSSGVAVNPTPQQVGALSRVFGNLRPIAGGWVFASDLKEMDVQHAFRHVMYELRDVQQVTEPNTWLAPVDLHPANPQRANSWFTGDIAAFVDAVLAELDAG